MDSVLKNKINENPTKKVYDLQTVGSLVLEMIYELGCILL